MAQRTPAKKFTFRTVSDKRIKRARTVFERVQKNPPPSAIRSMVDKIIFDSEKFLSTNSGKKSVFIFLGLGMRPFFEAVRAVNEVKMSVPRGKIRYFVTPGNAPIESTQDARIISKLARLLSERKIVLPQSKSYCIVDYKLDGTTAWAMFETIKRAVPKADISLIDQGHPVYGSTVFLSETFGNPTEKIGLTPRLYAGDKLNRASYLLFQARIRNYMNRMGKNTKK